MSMNSIQMGVGTLTCLLIAIGSSASILSAQSPASRDTLLSVARDLVGEARYAGLVTFDQSGNPRVRTMDPFLPDADWSIWMGTNRESRKVGDLQGNPRVTLYYSVPERAAYVAVYGTARLVDDPTEKASRWKDEWEGFYPDRDAQYLLIQVFPQRLEVIDYSRGIAGDPDTWVPPFVEFRSR